MGTRHLVAVQLDGEYKIAQYGQWDGYPEGQGVRVLKFLKETNPDAFIAQLRRLRWATDEQIEDAWVAAGAVRESSFTSLEVAEQIKNTHPELSRDTGAAILDVVLRAAVPENLLMRDNIGFAQDSLFCEWAYVIDFDTNVLEVYIGFQKAPDFDGRFAGPMTSGIDNNYGPVKKLLSYSLSALPTETAFLEDCEAACAEQEPTAQEATP